MNSESEINDEYRQDVSDQKKGRVSLQLADKPSDLLSKEGFALYIGKTPRAVAEMARSGKLPAFYMTDPLKPVAKLSCG